MKRVAWTNGTYLTQQHMQQSEMYWAWQHCTNAQMFAPHAWGAALCEFDDAALSVNQVRVLRLNVIFPNRTYVAFNARYDDELVCNITNEGWVCLVWEGNERLAGWGIEDEYVSDVFDVYREQEMSVLKPALFLQVTEDASIGIPIARLIKTDERYQFDTNFIGASVSVGASHALARLVDRVQVKLTDTLKVLHSLRDRYEGRAAFDKCMWLSLFLSQVLVQLENVGATYDAFVCLSECEAMLCAYHKKDLNVRSYDHAFPQTLFLELENSIFDLLDTLFPSGYQSFQLNDIGKSLWIARDIDKHILEKGRFVLGLLVEGLQSLSILNSQIKVADATRISGLVNSALPGIVMRKIEQFPHDLMVKPGFDYFYLDQCGPLWESVLREQSLAVFLPEKFHGCRVELLMMME